LSSIAENRFAEFGELEIGEEGVEFNLTACGERVRVPITQDQIAMLATISKRESSRDSSHFPHASWATLDPSSVQLQGSGAAFIFVDLVIYYSDIGWRA